MSNLNLETIKNSYENSRAESGSYHYIPLPLGTPQLPQGIRLSRKSTPKNLLAKDEKTGAYYQLINGNWEMID